MLGLRAKGTLRGFRTTSGVFARAKYTVGDKLAGYTIQRAEEVAEFNLTAVELAHDQTGSRHLHIDRQDQNNVFGIAFKTNPPNSTGLPHILEHTTLCGSEKYPVRDPFFKMLNRSLSNFMNAMTGHDYTFYPFATTNVKDFDNLMNVYLDATLHPLLTSEDFYQEGWRLEHEETKNKQTPLTFKGVVYNEMKGQVSDSSYYFWIKFQEAIYPSLNNSGGDPQKITDLSHEDLVDFQSKFYHPSNSYTYTYGNIPLKDHLAKINEAFQTFGKRPIKNTIKEPIKLTSERQVFEIDGPVDPMVPLEQQYKSSLTWYAGKPSDIYDTFLLKIVSTLLMDGHSSPLYQKLVESGYGTDFAINSGADSMSAINLFTVGLNGLTKEKSDKLDDTVNQVLQDAYEEGFADKKIKAIIHQLELSKKMESAKFGLNVLSSIVPGWVNEVDPINTLNWNNIVVRFNEEYKLHGDQILKDVMLKYVMKKPYFKYVMKPSEKLAEEIKLEELTRLEQKVSKLTDEDKEVIYERGVHLLEKQEEVEDLSVLPSVNVSDINREAPYVRINHRNVQDVHFQTRLSPKTNGLTYMRASKSISIDELDQDLIKYLPLFSSALTNLGTKKRDMAELEDEIKLFTGGLSANFMTHGSAHNPNNSFLKFNFNGVSLNGNFEKMLSLWKELLMETDFTNIAKLSTLVKSMTSDNLSDVVSSGHAYARTHATSKISDVGLIQEKIGGIENIQFLSELGKLEACGQLDTEVVPKLEKIRDGILSNASSGFKYGLTTSKDQINAHEQEICKFNKSLGLNGYKLSPYEITREQHSTLIKNNDFIEIPSQVSFAGLALNGPGYTERDASSLQVLSQLMTFKYLHGEIREKGGAYGGGASFDALNGLFSFYSYRDPKPFNSVEIFQNSAKVIGDRISSEEITDLDLEQAKLTIFQKLDAPISVREEGLGEFHYHIDEEMKQERRENLLDCSLDDVKEVSEKYFGTGTGTGDDSVASVSVIGHDGPADAQKSEWNILHL